MSRPLILAIEPDQGRGGPLKSIARRVDAELRLVDSVERALAALGEQMPDLILTPALLSTRDDLALTERLRSLGEAAAHIQTLTIPILEGFAAVPPGPGMFASLRREQTSRSGPKACEMDTFAEQVRVYLERAMEARRNDPQAWFEPQGRIEITADEPAAVLRDGPAMAARVAPAADDDPAAGSSAPADLAIELIDELSLFVDEAAATDAVPAATQSPAFEEFDLEAFMSEELLDPEPMPAPSAGMRRIVDDDLIPVLPKVDSSEPTALPELMPEELQSFLPEEPAGDGSGRGAIVVDDLNDFVSEQAQVVTHRAAAREGWPLFDPEQPRFVRLLTRLDELAAE